VNTLMVQDVLAEPDWAAVLTAADKLNMARRLALVVTDGYGSAAWSSWSSSSFWAMVAYRFVVV